MTRVLLVSDAEWVINDVESALSGADFELSTTDDPRALVDTVSHRKPHVVLVDMQVGSMGGMAIVRTVRDAAATERIEKPGTIVLMDRDADAFLAGRSGADGWLRKPVDAFALRDKIGEIT